MMSQLYFALDDERCSIHVSPTDTLDDIKRQLAQQFSFKNPSDLFFLYYGIDVETIDALLSLKTSAESPIDIIVNIELLQQTIEFGTPLIDYPVTGTVSPPEKPTKPSKAEQLLGICPGFYTFPITLEACEAAIKQYPDSFDLAVIHVGEIQKELDSIKKIGNYEFTLQDRNTVERLKPRKLKLHTALLIFAESHGDMNTIVVNSKEKEVLKSMCPKGVDFEELMAVYITLRKDLAQLQQILSQ